MRPRADARSLLVAAGYLAATALWVYALPRAGDGGRPETVAAVGLLFFVHALTGWAIGRWWAVALPLAAVVLAVPAGTPDVGYEPFPVWFGLAIFFAPPGVLVIAASVAARRLAARRQLKREVGAH